MGEKKKITPVVKADEVVVKKPSVLRRLYDSFIGGDFALLKQSIIEDTVIPKAKEVIVDSVTAFLYNGDVKPNKSTGSVFGVNYVDYSRYSKKPAKSNMSSYNRSREGFRLDDISFDAKAKAMLVQKSLQEIIDACTFASVSDLYCLIDRPDSSTFRNYGWDNIGSSSVRNIGGRWQLILPNPIPIPDEYK